MKSLFMPDLCWRLHSQLFQPLLKAAAFMEPSLILLAQ